MTSFRVLRHSVIVVIQLIFTLRMHPLGALPLIPRACRPHRQVARARGVCGWQRELALKRNARALRTGRLFLTTDEGLEVVATVLAGVFVDRYDDIPGQEFVFSLSGLYVPRPRLSNGTPCRTP